MYRKRQINSTAQLKAYFHTIGLIFIVCKLGINIYVKNIYGWLGRSLFFSVDLIIVYVVHRLFMSKYRENKKMIQNEKITNGIMEITSDILSCADTDTLLQIILEKAIDLIPNAQKGSILVLDGDEFSYKASVGYDFDVLKTVKLKLEETFQYSATGLQEPCIVTDIEQFNTKRLSDGTLSKMNDKNILEAKAVLSSAIVVKGEIYGTINLDNLDRADAFYEQDKLIIKHLADQIGIALNNAQLVAEMLHISRIDGLTGVYNRKFFEELFEQQYYIAKRNKQIFTVCVMDLNNLKNINDSFGHAAGDKLLSFFAKTIQANIREVDLFARVGGDEFTIVFLNTDNQRAHHIIEKIMTIFEQNPLKFANQSQSVSFAFGTAQYPCDGEDYQQLIKIADDRMYIHKSEMKGSLAPTQLVSH